MEPSIYSAPLADTSVDDLIGQDGVLESIATLDLDLPDTYIIQTLNSRIDNSSDYWNTTTGFNLHNQRIKNLKAFKGDPAKDNILYYDDMQWVDNEIFVGVDSIISYTTAENPYSEVYPSDNKPETKKFASDLEKYHKAHSIHFKLKKKIESAVFNLLTQHVGIIQLTWDPNYGENGEIIPKSINPSHVIIDKNAKLDENPAFICLVLKDSLEGLIARFPDKEAQILQMYAIQRKGTQNVSKEVAYREVWFTYYKDNKPHEAVAWYMNRLVLDKKKDPNWLDKSEGQNFLEAPMKPFIFFNLINDGEHMIDLTGNVAQALPMQTNLNSEGQQITDNLQTANGSKLVDSNVMTSDQAEDWDGRPNQTAVVDVPAGKTINDVALQLAPHTISAELIADKTDTRNVLHGILGTPSQFRGDPDNQADTASDNQLIKNQASGRQDKIIRAVDDALVPYFNLLTQFMVVHYTEEHSRTINGGDGNFDQVVLSSKKIDLKGTINIPEGTTLKFDKAREEAVAQNAAELGYLAPYDYFRMMHMDSPQKLYDNLVKYNADPASLAVDLKDDTQDLDAIMDYIQLMDGEDPKQREDTSFSYIEQFRKKMITDEFLKAPTKLQRKVIKFVNVALDSIEVRAELDELSKQEETKPVVAPIPLPVQQTIPPAPTPGMDMGAMGGGMPMQPQMGVTPGMPPQVPAGPAAPMGAPAMPQSPVVAPIAPPAGMGGIQGVLQTANAPSPQASAPTLNPQQPSPQGLTSLSPM